MQRLRLLRSFITFNSARSITSASTISNDKNVGFIGLGNMGAHMAENLVKNGYQVTVYDVIRANVDRLVSAGASTASCPAEVASKTKKIVTMLPSSPNVMECYTDSSTIDPMVSKQMAELANEKDSVYMDAPVSGGIMGAEAAVLTFMVGGPADKFSEAKSILSLMGKNIVHCGEVSTGQTAKICNNMLLAISMIGVSEAMSLGTRLGLDPKMLVTVLNSSSGRCWTSDNYNPCPGVLENVPSNDNYKAGFASALMAKDLGLAQDAATATKTPTPLGSAAHQIYRILCNNGYDQLDFSSVYKFLQNSK